MPKQLAAVASKLGLDNEEIGRRVRFHLGLQNRPGKIWWYKLPNGELLLSPVEKDDVIPVKGGGAS